MVAVITSVCIQTNFFTITPINVFTASTTIIVIWYSMIMITICRTSGGMIVIWHFLDRKRRIYESFSDLR